jgi:D-alanine transaminase
MARTVYLNGQYLPEAEARVSIFDRAFIFGDGVYEVTAVIGGRPIDFEAHLARLARSLGELEIAAPLSDAELTTLHAELIARNDLDEGIVYLQISRGVADRDFPYLAGLTPTVAGFTQAKRLLDNPLAASGVAVATIPDIRWKRRDIKSTSLLGQVMGKQEAKRRGAYEAWMVEDGLVTEGTSSSAYIVDKDGVLRTQPLGHHILPGVTRRAVLQLAKEHGVDVREEPFSVAEAIDSREALLTSASTFVLPVTSIDGHRIADGLPGPVTKLFRELYLKQALA